MTVESNTPEAGFDELDAIAAFLGPQDGKPEQQEVKAQVAEAEEAEPDEQDVESEESESEEEGTDDDEAEQEPEAATLEALDIDGEEIKLPADVAAKIKPHLLRQQDYTRKTQEVAEQRKAAEAERQFAQQQRNEYVQRLQVVQQLMQRTGPQPPDPQLLEDDPLEYVRRERAYHAHVRNVQGISAELGKQAQEYQQEQQKLWEQQLKQASAKLPELIPAWKDPAKAGKERAELRSYLANNGFSEDEINGTTDPRAVAISRKAWLYDQLIAQKKQAKPKPPVVAPAGQQRNPSQSSAVSKARQALKRSSGRDERAAEFLIGQFLKE